MHYGDKAASYVIFLCCFDPFDLGEAEYCFSMYDPRLGLYAGENRYTIMLNSRADEDKTPDHLRDLFRYMNESKITGEDSFLQDIDDAVGNCNTPEGELMIMTIEQELETRYRDGHRQGVEEGRKQGVEEGRKQGVEEGRKQTARALKQEGVQMELIVRCTGLTPDQIEAL